MSLLMALLHGGWVRDVDHALGASMRHARDETPDWVQSAAALASRALAHGHSRLPLSRLGELFAEIDPERDPPGTPPVDDWLGVLAASPWVDARDRLRGTGEDARGAGHGATPPACILVLEGDALALRRYWAYECRLAVALSARLGGDTRTDGAPATGLRLVTGGPGTGKTTQVAQLMASFAARAQGPPRILLAAPTGKAASRLSESVRESLVQLAADGTVDAAVAAQLPTEASTLHRLLGWRREGGFRHDRDNPLPADLVIVDEASMVDLPLMTKLAEAVPAAATLVLVGDRDQLPSVETGDVLAALCDASEVPGSPLAGHRVHLQTSHRQAADIDVPALAEQVRRGDADGVLRGLAGGTLRGVHWRRDGDRALHDAVLADALPHYLALAQQPDVASALRFARGYRILCALREGVAGNATLNAVIGRALDPLHGGAGLFQGRLVLVTENSYRQQLFNGDIGIVWPDEEGEPRVWFDADAGPRAWLPAALPAHEPAFAMTVHKSQGSEFDKVFLALPERGARVLSRELLYTGLTRCRRDVLLWAGEDALREAIGRRAQRWSGLAGRLARASAIGTGGAPPQGTLF
jgi:exodeoxyribonuclease V alpha subunit